MAGIVVGRRDRRRRRRAADACRRASRPGSRRRPLRLAQPTGVQRRQALRRGGPQARRRGRGGDRGAARRSAVGRRLGRDGASDAVVGYVDHILEHFGTRLDGLRIAVDCANGAYSAIAPGVLRAARRGGDDGRRQRPTGRTSTSAAARPISACCRRSCGPVATTSASHSTVTATACSRSTRRARRSTAIRSWPCSRSHLGVDTVAVTTMTNLGFHRLMAEHGVRVLTTDVGDRHVLAALRAEGAVLGGEQSGHVISLDGHVTGDGLAAALLLCRALERRLAGRGRRGDGAAAAGEAEHSGRPAGAVRGGRRRGASGSTTSSRGGAGSSFAPPARSPSSAFSSRRRTSEEAEELCGSIAHLVRQQLG